MRIDSNLVVHLRDKIKISDIISRKIKLISKGKEFIGLCPFHAEKTPSFTVNDYKQFYHCFGCGAHGDIVSFIINFDKINYHEAIEHLAKEAGIDITSSYASEKEIAFDRKLHDILEIATAFYHAELDGKIEALNYLKSRGLSTPIIKKFRIGYASNNDLLIRKLTKRFSSKEILEAGIFKQNNYNGEMFSSFRNRIIFPIFDIFDKVIALGGRALDGKNPKYLNSSETTIFCKRNILYGLNFARGEAFKKEEIIVTEGYMDTISLHNFGFTNTVATLGTSVNENHLKILWETVNEPVFCMDADTAGVNAMNRLAMIALKHLTIGKSVHFIELDKGFDPDDILRKGGKELFREFLNKKIGLAELLWKNKVNDIKFLETPERRALLDAEFAHIVSLIKDDKIKKAYKDFFKQKIWEFFKGKKFQKLEKNLTYTPLNIKFNNLSIIERYEMGLLFLLYNEPELLQKKGVGEFFENYESKFKYINEIYSELYRIFNEYDTHICIQEEVKKLLLNCAKKYKIEELITETSSFLDKININNYINNNQKWFLIVKLIHLETLKEEYQLLLKSLEEDSFKKAMEIKKKITAIQMQIRVAPTT